MSLNSALRSIGNFLLRVLLTPPSNIYPIQRLTNAQRLQIFTASEQRLYQDPNVNTNLQFNNKADAFIPGPFKYVYLSEREDREFTAYDSVKNPSNSATRDAERMGKFISSWAGTRFQLWQIDLQKLNPYNETTIYDPLTLVTGAQNKTNWALPSTRHIAVVSGAGNSIPLNNENATLSSAEYESSQTMDDGTIQGTATGKDGMLPYSTTAKIFGTAKYGLLRYATAADAYVRFSKIWSNPSDTDYGTAGTGRLKWEYRPEYSIGNERVSKYDGAYNFFKDDERENLKVFGTPNSGIKFYNDDPAFGKQSPTEGVDVEKFQRYYPSNTDPEDKTNYYADKDKIKDETIGDAASDSKSNIKNVYDRMFKNLKTETSEEGSVAQFRASAERYSENENIGVNDKNNYEAIPNGFAAGGPAANIVKMSSVLEGPFLKYLKDEGEIVNELKIDNRGFAKASNIFNNLGDADEYNSLPPTSNKDKLYLNEDESTQQSADLIFFYFYDMINDIYLPFRATISGIQDQHSPTWDEIKYMGRADSLYIYKGFTRDVSFSFKVYANSIRELVPMWKRINYLTGLTRPSGYTGRATVTATQGVPNSNPLLAGSVAFNQQVADGTTGLESGFIIPPMIRFRVGDLYVDHPAVLRSVNISIPDDATWETLRDENYKYIYGAEELKTFNFEATSRQLPNIVDVTVQLAMIERKQSTTNENHFGPVEEEAGWQMKL